MKIRFLSIPVLMLISIGLHAQPPETVYEGTVAIPKYQNSYCAGPLSIGFDFTFFGNTYSQFYVNENGMVIFGASSTDSSEDPIPTAGTPNNFIAAFWDDLYTDGQVLYTTIGASPNRKLIIQWKNMLFYPVPSMFGTFSLILYEGSNNIQVQFRLIVDNINERSHGSSATIGLENSDGSAGVEYAYHLTDAVYTETAVSFTPNGGTYDINASAVYDGIYLTTTPLLPEPGIATLISPPQNADIGSDFTFQWGAATYATSYSLRISKNSNLNSPTVYDAGSNLSYDVTGLDLDDTYYWGVFASNATGTTWCEIQRFTTSSTPLLVPVPQTIWTEQGEDKTIDLGYTGGDESPKTGKITSLPAQGALYQYNAGSRGDQITVVPTSVTDSDMKVIYAASGSSGNGVGNFNFLVNDAGGDSGEATITINVSPPGVPNVLYVAKSTNVEIQFDIAMADPAGKQDQFTVTVDGFPATISSAALKNGDVYTIVLGLETPLAGTETVSVAYTQGDVQGATGGYLFSFTDTPVTLISQTIDLSSLDDDLKYRTNYITLPTTSPGGLTVTYTSSDPDIASVSSNRLYLNDLGSFTLTGIQGGDATYAPVRNVKPLTVIKGDQTITFGTLTAKTYGDADFNLSATASSGLTVSFESNNEAVATVAGTLVHIVGAGSAVITASQDGNELWNAAPDVPRTLTVNKANQTITFDPLPTKTEGDPDFDPGASASSGLTVSYSSDNTDVATIIGGMIHIVAAGSANITASQAGNDNYNAADDVIQPLTVDVLTGLENPSSLSQNSIKLFSANNMIYIQPLDNQWGGIEGSIRIFNIIGKPIRDLQNIEFNRNSMIQLPAPEIKGLYLVEIKSGMKRFVGKVIVR